jgi:hypothetical protein
LEFGVKLEAFIEEKAAGRKDQRRDNELDFEITLAKLVPRAKEIKRMADAKRLISTNNARALEKLESGKLNFTKSEKNSLKYLLDRLDIET